jgi:hypothetical protein
VIQPHILNVGVNDEITSERMVLHVHQFVADSQTKPRRTWCDGIYAADNLRRDRDDHLVHQLECQKVSNHFSATLNHHRTDSEFSELREEHSQIE